MAIKSFFSKVRFGQSVIVLAFFCLTAAGGFYFGVREGAYQSMILQASVKAALISSELKMVDKNQLDALK